MPYMANRPWGQAAILLTLFRTLFYHREMLQSRNALRRFFSLVAPTRSMFIRGGAVTIVDPNDRGEYVLEILRPSAARSRFEKHGRLFAWRVGYRGKEVLQPSICPEETARAIIESQEARDLLPKISGLINCPFFKSRKWKIICLWVGYDEDTGVLVTGGEKPPDVPL
jgi:hypothetical protein